jgi:hypothetical protein
MPIKNILITGGTGLVGTALSNQLKESGYDIAYLSRSEVSDEKFFKWNPQKEEIDIESLRWADAIIHLGGASVAGKRWDAEYKKVMKDSRVKSLRLIREMMLEHDLKIDTLVSGSAIGYYGYDSGSIWKTEDSRFGDDFLATLTKEWESAADEFKDIANRIIKIRIGIVLSDKGGSLTEMSKPVKMGAGAALGSGDQYVSWIHIDDLSGIFVKAIEDEKMTGVYNGVAPEPVTNRHLMRSIAKTLGKPFILPNVPAFVMKIMLGEFSSSVLGSSRVSAEKVINSGFQFRYDKLESALENLLRK